jgi:predicted nucleic acid-binding protein
MLTLQISYDISVQAATLRARHNLRTPDSLQISAALNAGATHFLTNDLRLPDIPAINIIVLDSIK